MFNDPSDNPLAEQGVYGLLDARLTWDTPYKGLQAAVLVQNALNKVYYVNMYDDLQGFNVVDGQPGLPRTVLGTLQWDF